MWSSFQEMKNNPVHLITEEDLKLSAVIENAPSSKKDKRDERKKKAAGKEVERMRSSLEVSFKLTEHPPKRGRLCWHNKISPLFT